MLGVVPARGGSKGIKRKSLRVIAGRPLLGHKIEALRAVPELTRVVVTTDDPEIKGWCETHAVEVVNRPAVLAADDTPVAAAVQHACASLGWDGEVGVFQPTSPTLRPETISDAIRVHREGRYATTISVADDPHLVWFQHAPVHPVRANRQQLSPLLRETGGFFLCWSMPAGTLDPLVAEPTHLYRVPAGEAVDVDTADDLETARRFLLRKRIEFRFAADEQTGTGHLYRCLALADELNHHEVWFRWYPGLAVWAQEMVKARGYRVENFPAVDPDLVVFDCLDTEVRDVSECKSRGARVVTLEDLGAGASVADLTINELYGDGPRWAVLRPEFIDPPGFQVRDGKGLRTLVTFGGSDPAGLNQRVGRLAALSGECRVMLGAHAREFAQSGVRIVRGASMASEMLAADLVVCSAGRTANEAAALGVPTVTIAANDRESRHVHAAGVLPLGLHAALSDDQIRETVDRVLRSESLRREMSETSRAAVDGLGCRRIAMQVESLLEGLT